MKNIKTYENFLSKGLNKIWNGLYGKLIDAEFDHKENEILKKYDFNIDDNVAEFSSLMNDLKIRIKKYWNEEVPGYAPKLYKVYVYDSNNSYQKEFSDTDKLIEFIENLIPEEELNAKKYNL
jgi:transcriptional regulator of heat shock response